MKIKKPNMRLLKYYFIFSSLFFFVLSVSFVFAMPVLGGNTLTGIVLSWQNQEPIVGIEITITNTSTQETHTTNTNQEGVYSFSNLSSGPWRITLKKHDTDTAFLSASDAVRILHGAVGESLPSEQALAADVNGDGALSSIDALLVLRRKVDIISRFPVAEACDSDWLFFPFPNETSILTQPIFSKTSCKNGEAIITLSSSSATQDFIAIPFGDVSVSRSGYINKAKKEWIDLDVSYIERTPRYPRFRVSGATGVPLLVAGTEHDKRLPDVGEKVVYTAHILNKGNKTSSSVIYQWFVDGNKVNEGQISSIGANKEETVNLSRIWSQQQESIQFIVNPGNVMPEQFNSNNSLTVGSRYLSLSIFVEQGQYNEFNETANLTGTKSFEDWIQAQFATMNNRFAQAQYSVIAPKGVKDRVRIDKIVVGKEFDGPTNEFRSDPLEFLNDGRWQFTDGDDTNAKGIGGAYKNYVTKFAMGIDWGLIHELSHQLGVIDLYRLGISPDPFNFGIEVLDSSGNLVTPEQFGGTTLFPFSGIMGGGDRRPYPDGTYYENHTVGGLNSHAGQRRGYYGEYLYDMPQSVILQVLDINGAPIAGAQVSLYQKNNNKEENIDNIPEIVGTTDSQGKMFLTNRSVISVSTATGHTLHPNPFGQIDTVGRNGTMLVRVVTGNNEEPLEGFGWLFITDLNLAYWKGNINTALIPVKTTFPVALSTVVPSRLALISPNGKEVWKKGDIKTISWNGGYKDKQFEILLIRKNNLPASGPYPQSSYYFLKQIENNASTTYSWVVGNTSDDRRTIVVPEGDYIIRIIGRSSSGQVTSYDDSKEPFSIIAGDQSTIEPSTQPLITIIAPARSENFVQGSTLSIRWKWQGFWEGLFGVRQPFIYDIIVKKDGQIIGKALINYQEQDNIKKTGQALWAKTLAISAGKGADYQILPAVNGYSLWICSPKSEYSPLPGQESLCEAWAESEKFNIVTASSFPSSTLPNF